MWVHLSEVCHKRVRRRVQTLLLLFLFSSLVLGGGSVFVRSGRPPAGLLLQQVCTRTVPRHLQEVALSARKDSQFFTLTQPSPHHGARPLLLFRAQAVIGQLAAGRGRSVPGRRWCAGRRCLLLQEVSEQLLSSVSSLKRGRESISALLHLHHSSSTRPHLHALLLLE